MRRHVVDELLAQLHAQQVDFTAKAAAATCDIQELVEEHLGLALLFFQIALEGLLEAVEHHVLAAAAAAAAHDRRVGCGVRCGKVEVVSGRAVVEGRLVHGRDVDEARVAGEVDAGRGRRPEHHARVAGADHGAVHRLVVDVAEAGEEALVVDAQTERVVLGLEHAVVEREEDELVLVEAARHQPVAECLKARLARHLQTRTGERDDRVSVVDEERVLIAQRVHSIGCARRLLLEIVHFDFFFAFRQWSM